MPSLTDADITRTAKAAIQVLQSLGYACCLFGSAACLYYGMRNRVPNDVDIVVMDTSGTLDTEHIKRQVVNAEPNKFYLVPARNPRDNWKVLWYRHGQGKKCKVDILLPGKEPLCIPYIHPTNIHHTRTSGTPLLPFLTLLLLKLKGWSDHRSDFRQRMQDKVLDDEDDLRELLEMATQKFGTRIEDEQHLWPGWFKREYRDWIDEFVEDDSEWGESFEAMGFDVNYDTYSEGYALY